jgi:hypothetical protein
MTKEELETWLRIFREASVMGNELRSTGGQIATLVCVLLRDATAAELMRRKAQEQAAQ